MSLLFILLGWRTYVEPLGLEVATPFASDYLDETAFRAIVNESELADYSMGCFKLGYIYDGNTAIVPESIPCVFDIAQFGGLL